VEQWKPIPDFEGIYEISDAGRVRVVVSRKGVKAGRILSTSPNSSGYCQVVLSKNGRQKKYLLHRLVMRTFEPRADAACLDVNHEDCNKHNNAISNLKWCTHQQNIQHARQALASWRQQKGEAVHTAKLTESDIREIRTLSQSGLLQKEIAQGFGVSRTTISRVLQRKIWPHVL
jgi:hypothetical protein